MKKRIALVIISTLMWAVAFLAVRIYSFGNTVTDAKGDVAIVLGAAVWGKELSPVFRERINHAIDA